MILPTVYPHQRRIFQCNVPFPYFVFNDFLDFDEAEELYNTFPEVDESFYKYENPFECKRAKDDVSKMPKRFAQSLLWFNSRPFVEFLSQLTGIEDLTVDPYLRGGGAHVIEKGGFLDVHSDFGIHPKLNLYRRLNVLLYLNKGYREEFGGRLELWDREMKQCQKAISPRFNRLVVFETSSHSFHGHPDPWKSDEPRRSVAFYYYTAKKPNISINEDSTKFQRRPTDPIDPIKEEMRLKRNLGRLASNI